ncbi:LysR family transcriptional regulator [Vibrio nigripulchritudo]|uniref:LysR family transcriptional regulator n=1 Tax=Vibrio nigripulchritudo TaxID=28173 RepID=UPI002492554A|nr:LysR family transcriptional regulator [Vibrio nigripulchritudo]BDU39288.1 LysR family transcriptional regulator [Vibrio nigripulchritudo]BDU45008.1 LysR family transcriptional regulator [Vibrio nigripulchritudo]
MDRFLKIKAFVTVVNANSFSLAAEQLSVSISTVSKRVQYLEKEVGYQLLNRKGNKISLTNKGVDFYQKARDLLHGYHELMTPSQDSVMKGNVRLGLPRRFGEDVVFPVLLKFINLYPDIQLDVSLNDTRESISRMGYDLVLRIGKVTEQDVVSVKLGSIPRMLVAPSTLVPEEQKNNLDYISKIPIVLNVASKFSLYKNFMENNVCSDQVILKVNSDRCAINAISSLNAMTILPYFNIREKVNNGELTVLLPHKKLPSLDVSLIFPSRQLLTTPTRTIIDFLKSHVEEIFPKQETGDKPIADKLVTEDM